MEDCQASRRLFRFFQWNDLHISSQNAKTRGIFPHCNEQAAWLLECAAGRISEIEVPDFIVSAGDIIHGGAGELGEIERDFLRTERELLDRLKVPFLPCVGNHENHGNEGNPAFNAAYERTFGPGRRNYAFTVAGVCFIMIDSS